MEQMEEKSGAVGMTQQHHQETGTFLDGGVRSKIQMDEYQFNYQIHAQRAEIASLKKDHLSLQKTLERMNSAVSPQESARRIEDYITSHQEPLLFPSNDCFTSDTKIAMKIINNINNNNRNTGNNTNQTKIIYKEIKDIGVGDFVLSFDFGNDKYLKSNNNKLNCNNGELNNDREKIFEKTRNFARNEKDTKTRKLKHFEAKVTHIYRKKIKLSQIFVITFSNINTNNNNNRNESENRIETKCTNNHPFWCENKQMWCNISANCLFDYKNSNRNDKHQNEILNTATNVTNVTSVKMGQLEIGDICLDINGNEMIICDIKELENNNNTENNSIYVYNMSVNNTQCYFANNILVHNKCPHCVIL